MEETKITESKRPLVLVVAGLDSGGGAGVTADIMTIHDHHAWGLPVVTALTCQSLKRVSKIQPVSVEMFKETIKLALADWDQPIAAIKVGLITDKKILDCLLDLLDNELKGIPVVWDPVLTATAGSLNSADLKSNLKRILQHTTIFTPNLPEALELASWKESQFDTKGGAFGLCDEFLKLGAKAVLLKGGHALSVRAVEDVFKSETDSFIMHHERKAGSGSHGGGCALSSALAALVANGFDLHDAATLAKIYVTRGIFETEVAIDTPRPPIAHKGVTCSMEYLPHIERPDFPKEAGPFAPCPFNLGLYPVVPSAQWVNYLLALGVKTVQLRIKTDVVDDEKNAELCAEIERACFLGRSYRARVFIDDHYKLAIKYGAYGVHLGMEDVKTADLKMIKDAGLRLGLSTHGIYELAQALPLQPSYIALGHVFPTKTKVMPSKPQGLEKLQQQAMMLKGKVPTVAIGGIKLADAKNIFATGADNIAVVTAITEAKDPAIEVQKWIAECRTGPAEYYGEEPQTWQIIQDEQKSVISATKALRELPSLAWQHI